MGRGSRTWDLCGMVVRTGYYREACQEPWSVGAGIVEYEGLCVMERNIGGRKTGLLVHISQLTNAFN
jgi:hypothetical protein